MSNRPKGMSAREVWAQQTGKPKEQYPGSSKSSGSSTTVKAPTVNTKQLESLQKAYLGSLAPTSGETEAQTQLGNVITSKELGIAKAEQDPIPQGFVTGQSTAIEKSAALKALPLQTRLASLQAQRQAASDMLKTQLGFETEKTNQAFNQQQFAESQ